MLNWLKNKYTAFALTALPLGNVLANPNAAADAAFSGNTDKTEISVNNTTNDPTVILKNFLAQIKTLNSARFEPLFEDFQLDNPVLAKALIEEAHRQFSGYSNHYVPIYNLANDPAALERACNNISQKLAPKATQTAAAGQGNVAQEPAGLGPQEAMNQFWKDFENEDLTTKQALANLKENNEAVYKELEKSALAAANVANTPSARKTFKTANPNYLADYVTKVGGDEKAIASLDSAVTSMQSKFDTEQQSKAAENQISQDNYNRLAYVQMESEAAYLRLLSKEKTKDNYRWKEELNAISRSAVAAVYSGVLGGVADQLPDGSLSQNALERVNYIRTGSHGTREYGYANTDVWVDYQKRLDAARSDSERKKIFKDAANDIEASADNFAAQKGIPHKDRVELIKQAQEQTKEIYNLRKGKGSTGAVQERQDKLQLTPEQQKTAFDAIADIGHIEGVDGKDGTYNFATAVRDGSINIGKGGGRLV